MIGLRGRRECAAPGVNGGPRAQCLRLLGGGRLVGQQNRKSSTATILSLLAAGYSGKTVFTCGTAPHLPTSTSAR